ncbi:MAG: hypothetical protein WAN47_09590 [Nitrosotalea sp.]
MSSIQTRRTTNGILTASVVILAIIAVSAMLELHAIPLALSVPLFLVPVSVYTTIVGLRYKQAPRLTQDYTYYFTWAAVMLSVGVSWILLYEKTGMIIGVIAVLSIVLGYVYLNKIKSSRIYENQ